MTLQLGVKLSLDKGNVAAGAAEAAKAIDGIGQAAEWATAEARSLGTATAAVGQTATSGGRATVAAATAQTAASAAAAKATAEHAGAMKLSAFQAQNLSYQINDVVVSLASGMNPLTVLMQQGSQIAPIFGGVSGTLKAAAGFFTAGRIAAIGFGGGILLATKAVSDHTSAMREAGIAAEGLGRNLGTSAGEINGIARSSASSAGLSVSAARSMATEFTKTGKIGTENFTGLLGIVRDFATTTGTDATTAAKTLADLMTDPAKGADVLSQSLGLIDAQTARYVKRLVDQGNATEAVRVITQTLSRNLVDTGKTVSWYAQMWDLVTRAASNAADAVGRAVSPKVGRELIADLEQRLAALKARPLPVPGLQGGGQSVPGYGIWADKGSTTPDTEVARRAEIARLEEEIAKAKKTEADAAERLRTAEIDAARARAVDIASASASPAVQEMLRRRQLADDQKKLAEANSSPAKLSDADLQKQQQEFRAAEDARIAAALDAKTRAQQTWISETLRAQQLAQIDLQIAATRDPIERAELERKRALVTMAGQEIGTSEAAAAANLAYSRSIAEVSAQARGALADTLADVAARTRVAALVAAGVLPLADMNRELQIEAATRQLVAEAATAEGTEKERLLRLIADTRAAITAQTEAQKRQQALQEVASGEDRLQMLRTQIALVGQSEAVQARVLALLEAEQKIRQEGLQGTPEADRLRQQAVEAANLNSVLERQKAAWAEIKGVGGDAIDTIVEGLRTGKDVTQSLAESLEKELLKLAIANPLKNMLFGGNLPTITDVGGVLGNLFGGGDTAKGLAPPTSVATATITAGTVVINGGIAGAGGLFADSTGGAVSAGSVSRSSLSPIGTANDNGAARIAGAWGLFDGRRAFASELADPAVKSRLFAMTEAEVGGQGPQAQTAFMESVFNRASARGQTLQQTLGANYYAPESISRVASLRNDPLLSAKYDDILKQVQGGSNVSNWATGNASGSVGFGGGPQTAMIAGEKFGIEKPDLAWARLQQSSTQASQSISSLGASSTSAVDALGQFQTGAGDATKALTQAGGGIAGAGQTMSTSITSTATTTQTAFGTLTSGLTTGITGLLQGLGSILGNLGSGFGGLFGGIGHLFGFDEGGYTGSIGRTSVAGVVHGQEFVVSAAATARHRGLLEAINAGADVPGYASGGYVGGAGVSAPRVAAGTIGRYDGPAPAPIFQTVIENHTAAQIETRQEDDGRGGKRQVVVIAEAVGRAIAAPRSATQRAMSTAFGLKPAVQRR